MLVNLSACLSDMGHSMWSLSNRPLLYIKFSMYIKILPCVLMKTLSETPFDDLYFIFDKGVSRT